MIMDTLRSFTSDTNNRRVGKRNRPPTSCEPCRLRKLKCNRGSPCDTCIKWKKQSSCEYAGNANRGKPKQSNTGDRLQKLENIVLQFMQNGIGGKAKYLEIGKLDESTDHPEGSITTDVHVPTKGHGPMEPGTIHVQDGQMSYVDSSHWLSILYDIKEIREQLSLSNQAQEDQKFGDISPPPEVDLAFEPLKPLGIHEILQSLPPRAVCDSLLSQYFNCEYLVLPILHPLKFQKEYERFWEDPSKFPTLWTGLLFSILGIAATLSKITKMSSQSGERIISPSEFRLRTTQCLVLGKYSTAKAYALETLMLHVVSNFLGLVDSNINLWFLMGIIIRLALRMGYHRDSRNHSNISPFEGEMRRRLWANIYQLDVLMSFQLGLPSMIPTDYCDTEAPRNLNYSDFLPEIEVLPPSRPLSEQTLVLYTIVKGKVMGVFKKIVAHTQSLSSPSLKKTIMLDIEMRETYDNIPSHFKMTPVSRSFMDTSSTIMKRCSIELLYLKSIVVLHRGYLTRDASNSKYAKVRGACVDAAMDILARQADLYQACQPGGQLCNDQWMVGSLMVYDFLLASMVVCLQLSEYMRITPASRNAEFAKQFDALQASHMIWTNHTKSNPESNEAKTAAQSLELMIRAVKDKNGDTTSRGTFPPKDASFQNDSSFPYAEPVMEMIDGPENLDWTLLDQYFQNTDGLHSITSPFDTYSDGQGGDLFQSMGPDWTA